MAVKKKGLGAKGLGINALINTELEDMRVAQSNTKKDEAVLELELDHIEPNRQQPRKYFDETALEELAVSLKTYGMIQPIVVKKSGEYYEIIAGERRWRAAKIAGMEKVPVVVKKWEDAEAFEAALVENLQREDLNPMEEAESYLRLQEEFGLSQEKIAEKVGKSRSAITNSLRLLQLDPRVRNFVVENKLTSGHARTLLPITDGDLQFELAEHIIEEGLSVRAVEALVKAQLTKTEKADEVKEEKTKADETAYRAIEDDLKAFFSTKVKLKPMGKRNKGKIEIEYYSEDDLERLLALLKR
ncbi:MAG: ParB/RepB/Spo0J family partition protein [Anaerotignum sp.]